MHVIKKLKQDIKFFRQRILAEQLLSAEKSEPKTGALEERVKALKERVALAKEKVRLSNETNKAKTEV
tara:strand:+ start:1017 stop:1220 length:204 start_codon:yes stop_codon:yes gene_type:complete